VSSRASDWNTKAKYLFYGLFLIMFGTLFVKVQMRFASSFKFYYFCDTKNNISAMLKKIDIYIIKKFLGTYFLSILLIVCVAVVFDFTEKLDNFIRYEASAYDVITKYYLRFIPFFANLFSPLFVFISVIIFTSKMAYDSEIIAMISGGVSFRRLMRPYFISAGLIAIMIFVLGSNVIPNSNKVRYEFEDEYVSSRKKDMDKDIHMDLEPGVYVYVERFSSRNYTGRMFSLESYEDGEMTSRITANSMRYVKKTDTWKLFTCVTRTFDGENEHIEKASVIDTTLNLVPDDLVKMKRFYETMTNRELKNHIDRQQKRGIDNYTEFVVERHRRISTPFSALVLALIGVSLSSRKVRGGSSLHIGIGFTLSFSYILFETIMSSYAVNGNVDPLLAAWLPNITYALIGLYLYVKAPK
jgi:lipopolysaccharide export system permease protein